MGNLSAFLPGKCSTATESELLEQTPVPATDDGVFTSETEVMVTSRNEQDSAQPDKQNECMQCSCAATISKLKRKAARLRNKGKATGAENKRLKQQVRKLRRAVAKKRTINTQLEAELRMMDEENHEQKCELNELSQEFNKLNHAYTLNTMKLEQFQHQHPNAIRRQDQDYEGLKARNDQFKEQIKELKRQVEEKEHTIMNIQESAFQTRDSGNWITEPDSTIIAKLESLERTVKARSKAHAIVTCEHLHDDLAEVQSSHLSNVLAWDAIEQLTSPQNQRFAAYMLLSSLISHFVYDKVFRHPLSFVRELIGHHENNQIMASRDTLEGLMYLLEKRKHKLNRPGESLC